MAKQPRVPKFGNWDSDNIPYTAYFENARKGRGGGVKMKMNPNDPEENPEAFMFGGRGARSNGVSHAVQVPLTANFDKLKSAENSQFEGHNRLRGGNSPSVDLSFRSASLPVFGAWDERDHKSGEGFTVVFNKVKAEKQIAAAKFPVVPTQPSNYSDSRKNDTQPKRCCCLF